MALDFTLVLKAETAAAKAELEAAAKAVKKVGDEATGTGAKTKTAATGTNQLGDAARRASGNLNALAAAELAAARGAAGLGRESLGASGKFAGLGSAFSGMGARIAGAAGSMVGSVFAVINPVNLLAGAAAGAASAMVGWLFSASDEANAFTKELERQKTALEGVVAETERLRLERGMMLSGAETQDEQLMLDENNRLLAERAALQERLNSLQEMGGRAAGFAAQAEGSREALTAKIAELDAIIAANDAQVELNAATERNIALSEKVKASAAGIASALQSADGSNLTAAFAAAFPNANALLGLAQGIIATIGQAKIDAAASLVYSGRGDDPRKFGANPGQSNTFNAPNFAVPVSSAPGAGSGGGAAAARDEASALQDLIRSLEGEIEALRVTDPIQQEMLRHREALAGATEAERQKVEELIAAREREAAAMDAAKERAEFFEGLGDNALDALIVKGQSFNDVLKEIASSLIEAAIQAAIFGSGPFGSFFGGGSMFGGIIPGGGKAEGGMVHGPGTGTSDSILTPLSNGEYVVNAKATARNRALLEAINGGGRIGGMATGGMVGGDTGRRGGRGGGDLPAAIYMDLRGSNGDQAIEDRVRRGAAEVVSLYDRDGLAVSVQRISRDPKRRG